MIHIPRDPWALLSSRTPARIAIGRTGASLPTREVLSFALAHARARDAVHARLDREAVSSKIQALGLVPIEVESMATDRATYLRRPDLGRKLTDASRRRLAMAADRGCDIALLIGDGLSATAVASHAVKVVEHLLPHLKKLGGEIGPVVIAEGARVALGDEAGELLRAKILAVLIGERPGLSAPDSLGVYVTYAPRPGRTDAERNCISNVRHGGLALEIAAANLAWLLEAGCSLQATGVALKDRSGQITAASIVRPTELPYRQPE